MPSIALWSNQTQGTIITNVVEPHGLVTWWDRAGHGAFEHASQRIHKISEQPKEAGTGRCVGWEVGPRACLTLDDAMRNSSEWPTRSVCELRSPAYAGLVSPSRVMVSSLPSVKASTTPSLRAAIAGKASAYLSSDATIPHLSMCGSQSLALGSTIA
jgi:hypothetical protein